MEKMIAVKIQLLATKKHIRNSRFSWCRSWWRQENDSSNRGNVHTFDCHGVNSQPRNISVHQITSFVLISVIIIYRRIFSLFCLASDLRRAEIGKQNKIKLKELIKCCSSGHAVLWTKLSIRISFLFSHFTLSYPRTFEFVSIWDIPVPYVCPTVFILYRFDFAVFVTSLCVCASARAYVGVGGCGRASLDTYSSRETKLNSIQYLTVWWLSFCLPFQRPTLLYARL